IFTTLPTSLDSLAMVVLSFNWAEADCWHPLVADASSASYQRLDTLGMPGDLDCPWWRTRLQNILRCPNAGARLDAYRIGNSSIDACHQLLDYWMVSAHVADVHRAGVTHASGTETRIHGEPCTLFLGQIL